jgi:regulator of nonsense transcripts 1
LVHGAEQVILVGDHRLLGPVISSERCQKARYDMSLMQRLVLRGIRPIVLRMQYRMHPGLSEFPNEAFYEKFLKDGVTAHRRTWPDAFVKWPNPEIPLFFWNVKSEEEYYENGISFVNRHEAGCIAVLLDAMWRKGIKATDIGVITPYAGQQAFLSDNLPSMCAIRDIGFFEDLEIASVDAFQGREKNFIILSNVRANDGFDIGFLKDQRRLCVSLTRAKFGLIVIGCADTFAQNTIWCKFIEHCRKKGVFVEGNLNDLQPSEFEGRTRAEDMDSDDAYAAEDDVY